MMSCSQPVALFAIVSVLFASTAQAQGGTSVTPTPTRQPAAEATVTGTDPVKPVSVADATSPAATLTDSAAQPAASPAPTPEPPAPATLPTPSITGPLSALPPAVFAAGPLGKLSVNGLVSGAAMWNGNYVAGDNSHHAALSNGQVFIQKTDGWFQYYIQAGAYNIPALGAAFLATDKTLSKLYGPVPVAYVKLQAGKNTSFLIGELPTLIGAEYTFTFENMNVNRGLLWNQENAINRGIQVIQTLGKFTASLSWNDGFYSNIYSWLTGSLSYAKGRHGVAFVAGGNYGQTAMQTYATPVQNNGSIYNLIYTYTKGAWIIQPYFQYTKVPTNANLGIVRGASTTGGAILASYGFKHGFSLPARWEYISSSGNAAEQTVNLLYGPGSAATSITVTPTLQHGPLFVRGDFAYVHVSDITPGAAFGRTGMNPNQLRAMGEIGFMLGKNIVGK